MRTLLLVVSLSLIACGRPDPGDDPGQSEPCAQFGDLPDVVAHDAMPLDGFLLVDGYLCYAPRGAIRQETCTKYELYLVCTLKDYTYCPSWKATLSTGVDPLEVRARLYCGADRLPVSQ